MWNVGLFFLASAFSFGQSFAPAQVTEIITHQYVSATADLNRDGVPDLVYGPVLAGGVRFAMLNEDGTVLSQGAAPILNAPAAPGILLSPINIATADYDQDGFTDIAVAMSGGTIHLIRNLGSTQSNQVAFASDVVLENFSNYANFFAPAYVVVPYLKWVDFNQDGFLDLVAIAGVQDNWNAVISGLGIFMYFGSATGLSPAMWVALSNLPLDATYVDLDASGTPETLVVMTERFASANYSQELLRFTWQNSTVSQVGLIQPLSSGGRPRAVRMVDANSDGNLDYVFPVTLGQRWSISSMIYVEPANRSGDFLGTGTIISGLPAVTSAFSHEIGTLELTDADRDGYLDIIAARGYADPSGFADGELLTLYGPNLLFPTRTASTPLQAMVYSSFFPSGIMFSLPTQGIANTLQLVDLDQDSIQDVVLTGVRRASASGSHRMQVATLKNITPRGVSDGGVRRFGAGDPGSNGMRPRIGTEGGSPTINSPGFSINLKDAPPNAVSALNWGSSATSINFYGTSIEVLPEIFSRLGTTSPGGYRRLGIPIPNNTSLIQPSGFFQWIVYDIQSNRVLGSDALSVDVGQSR